MLRIDCRFPGGNIKVHEIQGETIFVSPDLRDTRTSWFYWAFRLTGAAGRKLIFRFLSDHPVGTRGPAISTDGRKTWHWTTEAFDQDSFRISVPDDADEIFLCFAPTYTQENWDAFTDRLLADEKAASRIESGFFAKSRKARPVELLHVGADSAKAKHHVVITARHHCCEMIADWVMEGIIATIARGSCDNAAWLRENVSFSFVPFVDKDGVEDGDQGKNRAPHDHNRDYGKDAIYPETAAVRNLVKKIAARYGKLDLFMDLHCPWIRGSGNENVYQVGRPFKKHADQQDIFGDLVEAACGPDTLPYFRADNYPYGKGWNVADNEADGVSSTRWAGSQPDIDFVTSFEIPYANCREVTVTPDLARGLGRAIATAIAHHLRG